MIDCVMTTISNEFEKKCMLERKINIGKRIFIVIISDMEVITLLYSKAREKLLDRLEIWHSLKSIESNNNLTYVSEEGMNNIHGWILLYESSDKVSVISDSNQYGTLFNYVKTGILSKEEMADVLLYNI